VRVNGALNINIRLVAVGAAAPHFYRGPQGAICAPARSPRETGAGEELGLWKVCPHTRYDPYEGIKTRR
jgi:hypothetical protein